MQPIQHISYFADRPALGSLLLGTLSGIGAFVFLMATYLLLPFLSTSLIIAITGLLFAAALFYLYRLQRGAIVHGAGELDAVAEIAAEEAREQQIQQERLENLVVLEKNVQNLQDELAAWPRRRGAAKWVQLATQLGDAHYSLATEQTSVHGARAGRDSFLNLKQAVGIWRKAVSQCPPDRAPLAWARLQLRIGRASLLRGRQQDIVSSLSDAVSAFSAAIPMLQTNGTEEEAEEAREGLANATELLEETANRPEEEITDDIL